MSTAIYPLEEQLVSDSDFSRDWLGELAVNDLHWVVSPASRYWKTLQHIPDIFAWHENQGVFDRLKILEQSVAVNRFRSCLDHIGRADPSLARIIRSDFESLPLTGKRRLVTAPETAYWMASMVKAPSDAVLALISFLNGELAHSGCGPAPKGSVTALGDLSFGDSVVKADYLHNTIVCDFKSLNVHNEGERGHLMEPYSPYSREDEIIVFERISQTLDLIEKVSPETAILIKKYVKVIMPLRGLDRSSGSTSQPRFPGRVLLRGVEHVNPTTIASSLIHEAMHQLLYVLELVDAFVLENPKSREVKAKSPWTGRDLALHSYIHACFIWYGLAQFWRLPAVSEIFDTKEVQSQLDRALIGFRGKNPTVQLEPISYFFRGDVLEVATALHDRIVAA